MWFQLNDIAKSNATLLIHGHNLNILSDAHFVFIEQYGFHYFKCLALSASVLLTIAESTEDNYRRQSPL